MGRLGAGDDPLGARELDRGLERVVLRVRARLHQAVVHEPAQHRRVAVVAQPPACTGGGTKSWPSVYIGSSGVMPTVSPKS